MANKPLYLPAADFSQVNWPERVLLTPSTLAIKRELFGMGRLHEYEPSHIRDLRASPGTFNPFGFRSGLQFWGIGGGAIAFDHGAATVRFGNPSAV